MTDERRPTQKVIFLNENIGGHATVHANLEDALREQPGIAPTFVHVPQRGLGRKVLATSLPGLGGLDLDLQPFREQLGASMQGRRALRRSGVQRRRSDFDVVHAYTQNSVLLSQDLLRSGPAIIASDSTNELNAYRLPYRQPTRFTPYTLRCSAALERRAYSAATLMLPSSHWAARSLRSYGVPDDRIRVLPFGVRLPETVMRRPSAERPRLTFVGYWLERKGGRLLLDVHQQQLADRCELLMVTTEPVESLPGVAVRDDVRPRDGKLEAIFAETSIFVFPSWMDQSPNVVLEAMAHGVPIIAARAGAVSEMVEDGVSGILVDPGDRAQLLAAIQKLLAAPNLAENLGAAARRAAEERFDIRRSAADLVEVVNDAVEVFDRRGPVRL